MSERQGSFDVPALFAAMDRARQERGLSWRGVADEMNGRASWVKHPLSPSTIVNMGRTGTASCQHALGYLIWLGRSPESFVTGFEGDEREPRFPVCEPGRILRWDIPALAEALDAEREARGLTWKALAAEIGCAPGQLSGLKRIRYGITIVLAMKIVAWLGRPSHDFMWCSTGPARPTSSPARCR